MKDFCIVIPIYKENLDIIETLSLNRTSELLNGKHYDIYFIKPQSLQNTSIYDKLEHKKMISFDDHFFKSIESYSQLCISYEFYNMFSEYRYLYILQLDCYLMYDEFGFWATQDYDYIGGPVVSQSCGWDTVYRNNGKKSWRPLIGNGGFSIRKVQVFKDLCDPNGEFRKLYDIDGAIWNAIKVEDRFFCNDIYDFYELRTPQMNIASLFSWDLSPDVLYEYFGLHHWPMCFHAFDKNIRFMKAKFPEIFDKPELVEYCETKHKEFFSHYYTDDNYSTMILM